MSLLSLRIAIFASSLYWIFATGIFGDIPAWGHALLLMAMLAAMLVHGQSPADDSKGDRWRRSAWLAFAAVLIAVALPYPFNIASPVLGAAAVLAFIPTRLWPAGRTRAYALEAAGWLLMTQSLIWQVLEALLARWHVIPLTQYALAAALRLLGEDAAASSPTVTIQTESGLVAILPTFELFHAHFFILLLIAAWFLQVAIQRKSLPIFQAIGAIVLFALARGVFVILLALHLGITNPVWSPFILALTAWPVVWFLPLSSVSVAMEVREVGSMQRARRLWPALTGIVLAIAGYYCDGGTFKESRRLLINEHNSQWEGTEDAFDTEWFGRRAGYNYYCLRQFLSHYFHISINHEELSPQVLANVDVLLLKTPTAGYSASELQAIDDFVRSGGGVLLLGDHTNVFGVSTYLNQICKQYGIRYNYDSQHGYPRGDLTLFEFRRGLTHPVARHVPYFMFGTGCTLDTSLACEPIVVGYSNQTKPADYAVSNFFLKDPPQLNRKVGMVTQIAGVRHGRGRLLAFTDSTVFSNFWMFIPGKPELMLGMVDWVCRSNYVVPFRTIALALVPIFLAGFIFVSAGGDLLRLVSRASLGFCLSFLAVQGLSAWSYPPLQPIRPVPEIVFCNEAGTYNLPRKSLVSMNRNEEPFTSFFNAPARLDLVPREYNRIAEALNRDSRALVMIGLHQPIPASRLNQLQAYVASGGRLLLVVTGDADTKACNELLERFGLSIATEAVPANQLSFASEKHAAGESDLAFVDAGKLPVYGVRGGSPLLITNAPERTVALAANASGKGVVFVLSCGGLVSDKFLGNTSAIPDARGRTSFRMVFWLFQALYEQKSLDNLVLLDGLREEGRPTLTVQEVVNPGSLSPAQGGDIQSPPKTERPPGQ